MRALRRDLGADVRLQASRAIATRLGQLEVWQRAQCVGVYSSFRAEVDTEPILAMAAAQGKELAWPVVAGPGQPLAFRRPTKAPTGWVLEPGPYGILEPTSEAKPVALSQLDLILVPALAVDCLGRRLGWGGGYYDRTLTKAPQATAIAVVFNAQVLDEVPAGDHDQPLHIAVTDARVWLFAPPS